jgi:hypothetical protein
LQKILNAAARKVWFVGVESKGWRVLLDDVDGNRIAASKGKDKVQGRFILNVVVDKGVGVFELLSSKNQALLAGRKTQSSKDDYLHVIDSRGRLYYYCDGFPCEQLDEDLHGLSSGKSYRCS